MKTVNDIIKIETKQLIHFLKENHNLRNFFKKMFNDKNNLAPKSYYAYCKYILFQKNYYLNRFVYKEEIEFKDFIIYNDTLFMDANLFSIWSYRPFMFSNVIHSDISVEEGEKWAKIKTDYLNLKKLLNNIRVYDR